MILVHLLIKLRSSSFFDFFETTLLTISFVDSVEYLHLFILDAGAIRYAKKKPLASSPACSCISRSLTFRCNEYFGLLNSFSSILKKVSLISFFKSSKAVSVPQSKVFLYFYCCG